MASVAYDSLTKDLSNGTVDLDTDVLKVALVTSSYVADRAAHAKFSDVTNEVTGTGYTAGGATLAGVTGTLNTATHKTTWTATNPSWASSTITARGAVVYKSTGTASTSPLISYIDFGSDITSTAAAFTITTLATSGFLTVTGS